MSQSPARGACVLFISFEGGEGVGKSTQAQILARRLEKEGHDVLLLREPGTTPLGQYLRSWLKSAESITPIAELYLFAAARAELVERDISPALQRGGVVVADRYTDSTVAYQGYGRGLDFAHIENVNAVATQNTTPDVTFLLDAIPEAALERTHGPINADNGDSADSPDTLRALEGRRFEDEELAFHRRVRQGFLRLADADAARWVVLDALADPDWLAEQVWTVVQQRM